MLPVPLRCLVSNTSTHCPAAGLRVSSWQHSVSGGLVPRCHKPCCRCPVVFQPPPPAPRHCHLAYALRAAGPSSTTTAYLWPLREALLNALPQGRVEYVQLLSFLAGLPRHMAQADNEPNTKSLMETLGRGGYKAVEEAANMKGFGSKNRTPQLQTACDNLMKSRELLAAGIVKSTANRKAMCDVLDAMARDDGWIAGKRREHLKKADSGNGRLYFTIWVNATLLVRFSTRECLQAFQSLHNYLKAPDLDAKDPTSAKSVTTCLMDFEELVLRKHPDRSIPREGMSQTVEELRKVFRRLNVPSDSDVRKYMTHIFGRCDTHNRIQLPGAPTILVSLCSSIDHCVQLAEVSTTESSTPGVNASQLIECKRFEVALPLVLNGDHPQLKITAALRDSTEILKFTEAMRNNTSVTYLMMTKHNFSAHNDFVAIADMIKSNNTLQVLSLPSNNLTESGAEAIADALKMNSSITYLDLQKNSLKNCCRPFINAMQTNSTLKTLNLGSDNLSGQAELNKILSENREHSKQLQAAHESAERELQKKKMAKDLEKEQLRAQIAGLQNNNDDEELMVLQEQLKNLQADKEKKALQ
eukprot:gene2899-570_t